ncbi:MAG: DUF2059 domain-containing protein [Terracidiphilus sp.]
MVEAPAQVEAAPATAAAIPLDQQPTREQLVKLFDVMRIREQMASLTKMMPELVQQQVDAQSKELAAKMPAGYQPTPEQQAARNKLLTRYMEKAMTIYTVDEMLDDMTAVYQRHLTRTDVDAFIAFYSSPAGQHLLDAQPVIMREYMPVVMQRVRERSRALTDEMNKEMDELMKFAAPAAEKSAPKK